MQKTSKQRENLPSPVACCSIWIGAEQSVEKAADKKVVGLFILEWCWLWRLITTLTFPPSSSTSRYFSLIFLPHSLHFILLTLKARGDSRTDRGHTVLLYTSLHLFNDVTFFLPCSSSSSSSPVICIPSIPLFVLYLFTSSLFSASQTDSFSQRVITSVYVCVAWISHKALYYSISVQL